MFINPRLRKKATRRMLQQDAYQYVGQYAEHRSSPSPNGNVGMLIILPPFVLAQPVERPIAERCPSKTHQGTYQQVPRVMCSQIRTGITHQQSPHHNESVQDPVARQIRREESQSECIGDMAGRGVISPTPITVYDIHKF